MASLRAKYPRHSIVLRLLIFAAISAASALAAEARVYLERGHSAPVSAVTLSPDGRFLLTGSWNGTAKLWDAVKGAEVRTGKLPPGWEKKIRPFPPELLRVLPPPPPNWSAGTSMASPPVGRAKHGALRSKISTREKR